MRTRWGFYMAKYDINDFMRLRKSKVLQLNQSNFAEYRNMIKNINCTPIREYNYVKGMFVDTLFVGVVKSIKKSISQQGTRLGRLTFRDCSGELCITLFEDQIHEVFELDLDVPIGIVLRFTNNPKCMSPEPGYRFMSAVALF